MGKNSKNQYGYHKTQNLMLILNQLKMSQKTHAKKIIDEKATEKGSFFQHTKHFFKIIR